MNIWLFNCVYERLILLRNGDYLIQFTFESALRDGSMRTFFYVHFVKKVFGTSNAVPIDVGVAERCSFNSLGGGGVKCLFSPVWVKQMARWLGGWASLKREVSLEKKDQQYLYVYTFIRPLGIDSKKDLCRFINVLFVCSRPWLQYLFHRK